MSSCNHAGDFCFRWLVGWLVGPGGSFVGQEENMCIAYDVIVSFNLRRRADTS